VSGVDASRTYARTRVVESDPRYERLAVAHSERLGTWQVLDPCRPTGTDDVLRSHGYEILWYARTEAADGRSVAQEGQ